jgi:hypothetical protein
MTLIALEYPLKFMVQRIIELDYSNYPVEVAIIHQQHLEPIQLLGE